MRLRGIYFLAVAASVAAVLVLAGPASAANPPFACGATIEPSGSATYTLIGNLDCTGYNDPALTVEPAAGKTVTLNLGVNTITAHSGDNVIHVEGPGTTVINGGKLVNSGDADALVLDEVGGDTVNGTTMTGDGSSSRLRRRLRLRGVCQHGHGSHDQRLHVRGLPRRDDQRSRDQEHDHAGR